MLPGQCVTQWRANKQITVEEIFIRKYLTYDQYGDLVDDLRNRSHNIPNFFILSVLLRVLLDENLMKGETVHILYGCYYPTRGVRNISLSPYILCRSM